MKKKTHRQGRSNRYKRYKRSKRKKRTHQRGGACLPCLGIPPIAKALGLTALGTLAMKKSSAKRTRSGETYKTTLQKRSKNQKLQKIEITLSINRDKAILKKNNRKIKIKIKGDPKKQYKALIKSCESKGFDKC
tara:strand:+ start:1312 stop:1713 length:402 start_codon:yes stop_codon:yes gene_type:complete